MKLFFPTSIQLNRLSTQTHWLFDRICSFTKHPLPFMFIGLHKHFLLVLSRVFCLNTDYTSQGQCEDGFYMVHTAKKRETVLKLVEKTKGYNWWLIDQNQRHWNDESTESVCNCIFYGISMSMKTNDAQHRHKNANEQANDFWAENARSLTEIHETLAIVVQKNICISCKWIILR